MVYALIEGSRVREVVADTVSVDDQVLALADRYPPALVAAFRAVPAALTGQVVPGWSFDGTDWAPPVPFVPVVATRWHVPFPVVCDRVRAAGGWDAFTAALDGLTSAQRWHLTTLIEGVASDDAEALALLRAVGLDPAAILARVGA